MEGNFEIQRIERAERAIAEQMREGERHAQELKLQYLVSLRLQRKEQRSYQSIQAQVREDANLPIDARKRYALARLRGRFLSETRTRTRRLQDELLGLKRKGEKVGKELALLKRRTEVLSSRKELARKRSKAQNEDARAEEQVAARALALHVSGEGAEQQHGSGRKSQVSEFKSEIHRMNASEETDSASRRVSRGKTEERDRDRKLKGEVVNAWETRGVSRDLEGRPFPLLESQLPPQEFEKGESKGEQDAGGRIEEIEWVTSSSTNCSESYAEVQHSEVFDLEASEDVSGVSVPNSDEWHTQYTSENQVKSSQKDDQMYSLGLSHQVEQLDLFRKAGKQGMSLHYRLSENELVEIDIQKGADGKLVVHLSPKENYASWELNAVRERLLTELRERGLSVSQVRVEKRNNDRKFFL